GRRARGRDGKRRPGKSEFHGNVARPGVRHGTRDGERIHARPAELVEVHESGILRTLASDTGSADDGRRFPPFPIALTPGVAYRLARRDHRALRETVHVIGLLLLKVAGRLEVFHFGSILESQLIAVHRFHRANPAATLFERTPEFGYVMA